MRRTSSEPSATASVFTQLDGPLVSPTSVTAQPSPSSHAAQTAPHTDPPRQFRRQPVTDVDQPLRHLAAGSLIFRTLPSGMRSKCKTASPISRLHRCCVSGGPRGPAKLICHHRSYPCRKYVIHLQTLFLQSVSLLALLLALFLRP
jgi:hypothetical protein